MVTKDEALKMALEALIESWHLTPKPDYARVAITAIKEALAQPAQEPFDTHASPGQAFDTHSRKPAQEPVTLKMAIEALEAMQNAIYNIGGEHVIDLNYAIEKADVAQEAIKALEEALAKQERKPLTREQEIALREAHENTDTEIYFEARPLIDTVEARRVFAAGHKAGWEAAHGIKE